MLLPLVQHVVPLFGGTSQLDHLLLARPEARSRADPGRVTRPSQPQEGRRWQTMSTVPAVWACKQTEHIRIAQVVSALRGRGGSMLIAMASARFPCLLGIKQISREPAEAQSLSRKAAWVRL